MTDRELEERLRAWYAAEVGESERAPAEMRERIMAIPASTPMPLRPIARRRNFTLLAVAAVLVVGGGLAAGAGLMRFTSVVPPLADPTRRSCPRASPPPARPTAVADHAPAGRRPDRLHPAGGEAGTEVHELPAHHELPDPLASGPSRPAGAAPTSCPDRLRQADARGLVARRRQPRLPGRGQAVRDRHERAARANTADTGCVAPCSGDSQVELSDDGTPHRLRPGVLGRRRVPTSRGHRHDGPRERQVAELNSTSPAGGGAPTLVAGRQADRVLLVRLEARRRARSHRRCRPSGWSIATARTCGR